jgi:hypothetical protein
MTGDPMTGLGRAPAADGCASLAVRSGGARWRG